MDVISILEKKRQDVRAMEVVVKGAQRVDEYPKIYERIDVEFVVTGFGVSEAAVARAIELSETKYCSVRAMLLPGIEIDTSFRVLESPAPGHALLGESSAADE
jgi:putative redox protein